MPKVAASIQGYYTLPNAVFFGSDALSSRTKIAFGDIAGEISLPCIDPLLNQEVGFAHPLLAPKSYVRAFDEGDRGPDAWGQVIAIDHAGHPVGAAVRSVMLRFAVEDDGKEAGNKVGGKVVQVGAKWFGDLALWLEAFTGQDLDPEYPLPQITGGSNGFFLWGGVSRESRFLALGSQTLYLRGRIEQQWVHLQSWRDALRRVSRAEGLPLEWELLVSATRAARRGYARRAVVEAGSAVELALDRVLSRHLGRSENPAIAGAVLKKIRMLGPRLGLCREIGVALPAGLEQHLVAVRNKAVHGGASPNEAATLRALALGRQVIEQHVPLS